MRFFFSFWLIYVFKGGIQILALGWKISGDGPDEYDNIVYIIQLYLYSRVVIYRVVRPKIGRTTKFKFESSNITIITLRGVNDIIIICVPTYNV